jgi:hypothetical protein
MTETRVTLLPKPDAPIACTLGAAEAGDRTAQWAELLGAVTARENTDAGLRLRLPSDPAVVARVAGLAVREADCCAFFAFAITVDHDAVWLEVAAPADGRAVVERLFA